MAPLVLLAQLGADPMVLCSWLMEESTDYETQMLTQKRSPEIYWPFSKIQNFIYSLKYECKTSLGG